MPEKYRINENTIIRLCGVNASLLKVETGESISLPRPVLASILSLNSNFTEADFIDSIKYSRDMLEAEIIFSVLRGYLFIETASNPTNQSSRSIRQDAANEWQAVGWTLPLLMIEHARSMRFIQGTEDGLRMQHEFGATRAQFGHGQAATRSLELTQKTAFSLPPPNEPTIKNFSNVLKRRRTVRTFSTRRWIDGATLSGLLDHAAMAQKMWSHKSYGLQFLRTAPSGGARHPVEVYPQVIRASDIDTGSYLYCPVNHELIKLGEIQTSKLNSISQQQIQSEDAACIFIITTRYPRNYWKYHYARSFLFAHYDVGHLVQNLVLSITAFGMNSFLTPALDIDNTCKYLSIEDPLYETPSYFVAAG